MFIFFSIFILWLRDAFTHLYILFYSSAQLPGLYEINTAIKTTKLRHRNPTFFYCELSSSKVSNKNQTLRNIYQNKNTLKTNEHLSKSQLNYRLP